MRREQEHMLDACLFPCLQKALRATFRRAEQPECIGNLARLMLRDCRGIVRWLELEPGLFQPVKIRCARIGEKRLTWCEGAPHPSRARFGGSEAERTLLGSPAVSGPLAPLLAPGGETLRG